MRKRILFLSVKCAQSCWPNGYLPEMSAADWNEQSATTLLKSSLEKQVSLKEVVLQQGGNNLHGL